MFDVWHFVVITNQETYANGDPELLDDSEFYQQLLKEFFETIDPASSGKASYAVSHFISRILFIGFDCTWIWFCWQKWHSMLLKDCKLRKEKLLTVVLQRVGRSGKFSLGLLVEEYSLMEYFFDSCYDSPGIMFMKRLSILWLLGVRRSLQRPWNYLKTCLALKLRNLRQEHNQLLYSTQFFTDCVSLDEDKSRFMYHKINGIPYLEFSCVILLHVWAVMLNILTSFFTGVQHRVCEHYCAR